MLRVFFLLYFIAFNFSLFSQSSVLDGVYYEDNIAIVIPENYLSNSILNSTVKDFTNLLDSSFGEVKVFFEKSNFKEYNVLIELEIADNEPTKHKKYPNHSYSWNQKGRALKLSSSSYQGLSFGLYGLLQEKLGYAFYHPKETKIPYHQYWPLIDFKWEAKPRFSIKGFHLHTQHPLELTEYLLDYNRGEEGIKEVKDYIDWLVRNQQNYFQFLILESIDRKKWAPYFKQAVDYANSRGVLVGLSLSLHSIQQKAFMLHKNFPASWKSKKKQIKENIDLLCQIKWDYWNVDFKRHEFTHDKSTQLDEYKSYVHECLKPYGVKLKEHYHVVKQPHHLVQEDTTDKPYYDFLKSTAADIHTVMFYGLTDDKAPVYENENLKHMYSKLKLSNQIRETWYFPESAYWVTFDNSIPMLLLPYLNARLDDIKLVAKENIAGHITFSSGWEWGYWLIDWSIARWSWEHTENGKVKGNYSIQYVEDLLDNKKFGAYFQKELELQQEYIKDKELIRYLVAQAPTDELPEFIFQKEFHPSMKYSYKYIHNKATKEELEIIRYDINLLNEFVEKTEQLRADKSQFYFYNKIQGAKEFDIALDVLTLRAKHKALTLSYIVEERLQKINKVKDKEKLHEIEYQFKEVSKQAQDLVLQQEGLYRYPVNLIARKRKGHTAYKFGYLYPVSDLHFWRREESQVLKNKYSVFHKNIWKLLKISGVIN